MKLTDIAIRKAKPAQKPYKLADGRGMYVLIKPNGSRWWRLKYRWQGTEKSISLGVYPDVTLSVARERCNEARKLLANGINPSEARRAAKSEQAITSANTFEAVAQEWLEQHKKKCVKEHSDRTQRRLELHVLPWIGARPIASIGATDLLPHLRRVEQSGAIETAHRVLNICSQIMRYAVVTGRLTHDPTTSLRGALSSPPLRHLPAITDPARLGEVLALMDGYAGTLPVRTALRIAPLVFVRPGELRKARWSEISFQKAEWAFTSTKRGVQLIVPLSHQVITLLQELHPLTGSGEYVFPNARSSKRPMSDVALLAALRRLGIAKEEMCGHGFRASARTIMDEVLGIRPDIIEHQLTHTVRDPLGRAYNRTEFLPERRQMMQRWADHLDSIKPHFSRTRTSLRRIA